MSPFPRRREDAGSSPAGATTLLGMNGEGKEDGEMQEWPRRVEGVRVKTRSIVSPPVGWLP